MSGWRDAQRNAIASLSPDEVLTYVETMDALNRDDTEEQLTNQRRRIADMLNECGFHAAARKVRVKFDEGW